MHNGKPQITAESQNGLAEQESVNPFICGNIARKGLGLPKEVSDSPCWQTDGLTYISDGLQKETLNITVPKRIIVPPLRP